MSVKIDMSPELEARIDRVIQAVRKKQQEGKIELYNDEMKEMLDTYGEFDLLCTGCNATNNEKKIMNCDLKSTNSVQGYTLTSKYTVYYTGDSVSLSAGCLSKPHYLDDRIFFRKHGISCQSLAGILSPDRLHVIR